MDIVPSVEVDFSEDTSTAASFVRRPIHPETNGPREPKGIGQTFGNMFELGTVNTNT